LKSQKNKSFSPKLLLPTTYLLEDLDVTVLGAWVDVVACSSINLINEWE